MKRIDNIYDQICSLDNLRLAEALTREGKKRSKGAKKAAKDREILAFDRDPEGNLRRLHEQLVAGEFRTSLHRSFRVHEPKERVIETLPYYPDGVLHQAILNVLGPMFLSQFEANTYSSIKGRGIKKMRDGIVKALRNDPQGTRYCLSCDIKKFFPSVKHGPMKAALRRKIKDGRVLALLFEILDSIDGLPIGDRLSQPYANYIVADMDRHFAARHYFRFTDNVTLFGESKEQLRENKAWIGAYYKSIGLEMKGNWQIFPVDSRGVDAVGYVFYHTHTALRKSLKKRIIRASAMARSGGERDKLLGGYCGWLYQTDSINFNNKYQVLWRKPRWRR